MPLLYVYWYRHKNSETGLEEEVNFYAESRQAADDQYEEDYEKKPLAKQFLRREDHW